MLDLDILKDEIIGNKTKFKTPFGERLITYSDFIASGKTLKFIEKYMVSIQEKYANTHTEDDFTGKHMTNLLHEAEERIKKCVNAGPDGVILECRTGATGAIHRFQEILGIYVPPAAKSLLDRMKDDFLRGKDKNRQEVFSELDNFIEQNKPVVFHSSYEHHSNDVMWRECLVERVEVVMNSCGELDLEDLKCKVSDEKYKGRLKIGSFSASSNVTGILTPVYEVARILHKHDCLACFDFAASAPYSKIDMNLDGEAYFDAIYVSSHKFLGGPGGSGLLIFNSKWYRKDLPPTCGGGGTVDYVSAFAHDYCEEIEERERPGTPGILQTIKASLVFELKEAIGIDTLEEKEREFSIMGMERLKKHPSIVILGCDIPEKRLPIFSIMIKHDDRYLHPKFVTALLNDLFGIQSRAGCMCAGPYGHRLLSIDDEISEKYRQAINNGYAGLKPGWCRLNFHYTYGMEEFNFICSAVEFVADHGYRFLPLYMFDLMSGLWLHKDFADSEQLEFGIDKAKEYIGKPFPEGNPINRNLYYIKYLDEADKILNRISKHTCQYKKLPSELEELSFFYFCHEMKSDKEHRAMNER